MKTLARYWCCTGFIVVSMSVMADPPSEGSVSLRVASFTAGGVVASQRDGLTVSGSFGQWDATEAKEQQQENIAITGGFWAFTVRANVIFRDQFGLASQELSAESNAFSLLSEKRSPGQ